MLVRIREVIQVSNSVGVEDKSEVCDNILSNIFHVQSGSEGKLIEENGKLNATETSDDIILDGVVVNPSPGVASEQNKQLKVAIES